MEHPFQGIHIIGEFYGVNPLKLDDENFLVETLKNSIAESGATLCGIQSKKFSPQGVSVLAMLSESHASLHSFPEKESLFLDVFTCGTSLIPQNIVDYLTKILKPKHRNLRKIQRGIESRDIGHYV